MAASQDDGKRITQFLAGVPVLLDRYEEASPAARALLHAAMDARRMGCGIRLPLALLADAAAGYIGDFDWDDLADDWLEQALAYAGRPCNGIRGLLTRIRPRPDDAAPGSKEPRYRLADYLEQTGRRIRSSEIPPPAFWAAIRHADPGDLTFWPDPLATMDFCAPAPTCGNRQPFTVKACATAALIELLRTLDPTDRRPQRWAVTHIGLDKPHAVADLLDSLRKAGAHDDVTTLLNRDPASHALLDYPFGVISLLDALRAAGAEQQVLILAERAAAHMPLIEPISVVALLDSLLAAGSETQTLILAERAAARIPLDFPDGVARLLDFLLEVGTDTQVTTLLGRDPSAHALLDDPGAVADLLNSLRNAGAYSQVTTLLGRNPSAHVPLHDPEGVDALLDSLMEAGAEAHALTLLRRDLAAHVSLDDRSSAYGLLDRLRNIGADVDASVLYGRLMDADPADPMSQLAEQLYQLEQPGADTETLAQGVAEQVPLDDSIAIGWTLRSLWNAGADTAVFILAERAAEHLALDNPYVVADALDTMRKAGADAQVAALLKRDLAARACLDHPQGVVALFDRLRQAGAIDQASALAWRAAEGVVLEKPDAVSYLLESLQKAGFATEVRILVARLPAAGMFSLFLRATADGMRFRYGREADDRPSAPWSWDDLI